MRLHRFTFSVISLAAGYAQTGNGARGIVPEEVLQSRPKPKTVQAAATGTKPGYRPVGQAAKVSEADGRQVGVTIWRLRHAESTDTGARILVQEDERTVEWVPERVAAGSRLKEGDRVRLTIEAPENGYLYVIDRERYANGRHGEPWLIFPTARTNHADNHVNSGKLIDIPAQDDRPNYFSLHSSAPNQTEEELTVLVTSQPLEDISVGEKPLRLTDEQVGDWEKRWGSSRVDLFELSGGAGKTWTEAEQKAAADQSRLLTQEDPPPQTVYRVAAKKGEPVMVKVHLRYR